MKTFTRYISGLNIQKDYISIAQYATEENSVLLIAIQPLSGGSDNTWGHAESELKELKGKFKFYSPDLICSVPSEYAIVKHIKVDIDEPEIAEVIEWELSQQLNGTIDEYVYDYQETVSEKGYKNYLVVAYRKENVHGLSSMLKSVKLNPLVVEPDAFALVNLFESNYGERISVPAVIAYGESDRTKFILTQNGDFLDSDTIDYGLGEIDPGSYGEKLGFGISRFLALNNLATGKGQVGLYAAGSLFSHSEYKDVAEVSGCEMLNPFRKIGCRVGIDEERLAVYAPQLAVAVGLALRGNDQVKW